MLATQLAQGTAKLKIYQSILSKVTGREWYYGDLGDYVFPQAPRSPAVPLIVGSDLPSTNGQTFPDEMYFVMPPIAGLITYKALSKCGGQFEELKQKYLQQAQEWTDRLKAGDTVDLETEVEYTAQVTEGLELPWVTNPMVQTGIAASALSLFAALLGSLALSTYTSRYVN